MSAGTATPYQAISCKDCGEPIAHRYPGGGLRLLTLNDARHDEANRLTIRIDPDGRFVLPCPACGHRVRFRVQRPN